MSRNRFLTFPNALSLQAVLTGFVAMYFGYARELVAVVILLILGGVACVLDGWFAERYNQRSKFGDEVLQPLAGLSLGVAGVGTLWWQGYWPAWAVWPIIGFFAFLQGIDLLAHLWPKRVNALRSGWSQRRRYKKYVRAYNVGRVIRWAKRHQFWLHPLGTIALTFVAATHLALIVWDRPGPIFAIDLLAICALLRFRYKRLQFWLAGPQPQSPTQR